MAVNTRSVFLCSTAAVPVMQAQGKGVIINMASIGGLASSAPGVGFALYGASKAAVVNLTRSMAVEWAPQIRVNAIAPGQIDTPRVTSGWNPEQRAAQIRRVAMGRNGLPEDIAGAAVYLASDAAAWTTGICLEVHGGLQSPDRRLT